MLYTMRQNVTILVSNCWAEQWSKAPNHTYMIMQIQRGVCKCCLRIDLHTAYIFMEQSLTVVSEYILQYKEIAGDNIISGMLRILHT